MIGDWNGSYEQGHGDGFEAIRERQELLEPWALDLHNREYRRGYEQGRDSAKRHRAAGRI